ncbi:MAG: hypothetical protein HY293_06505 [Planctomycetes bacterium]|nr:hypothetical protein [Planctomycetota bacterium]
MKSLALLLLALAPQAEPAPLDPIQKVEIGKNREILVNGKPFFPLMSWAQSPRRFPLLRSLGFNAFCGGKAKEYCDAAKKAGGYAMPGFDEALKGHAALLAWTQGDEPDLGFDKGKPRKTAEDVVEAYKRLRGKDDTRPVFQNLTSCFMESGPDAGKRTRDERKAYYGVLAEGADLFGFDIYPIYGWNKDKDLVWVADGVRDLRELAGPRKPVIAFIETSKGSKWIGADRQKDVKPEHTRAEVWMAILRGATGIAYFTHAWVPEFTEFRPDDAMQKELQRLNGQITRLAPVLLGEPAKAKVTVSFTGGLKGDLLAREHEGRIHLFANNLDMDGKSGSATFAVEELKKGTKIEVIDEGRQIAAGDGTFSDEFGPLALHLYRIEK